MLYALHVLDTPEHTSSSRSVTAWHLHISMGCWVHTGTQIFIRAYIGVSPAVTTGVRMMGLKNKCKFSCLFLFVGLVSKSKTEVQETNEDVFLLKSTDMVLSVLRYANCRFLDQLCILVLCVCRLSMKQNCGLTV